MDALATVGVFLFERFRFEPGGGGLFRRDETGAYVRCRSARGRSKS
jgi:hypothetical protein